ncbi:MAG: glycosyltransferase [Bacteroidales bacterium]
MKFSVIIPVYNRPDEVEELLMSLDNQLIKPFEIILVEDGSVKDCRTVTDKYKGKLDISYFYKENGGPALARNYGSEKAKFDYFVFFDSDCIIPENYFRILLNSLEAQYADAYGGPDAAHENFTPVQKAISYSMTSFFTTGGIRGGTEKMEQFKPRSFNMGYSRKVYEKTGGFSNMRFGEDVDMSLKIIDNGFKTRLIKEAFVYHKRRTDFRKFFKQVYNSGIARINLEKRHPGSLKLVHTLPAIFLIGSVILLIMSIFNIYFIFPLLLFIILIFLDSFLKSKSTRLSLLSIISSFVQLYGYGIGFIIAWIKRYIFGRQEFHAFKENFYK